MGWGNYWREVCAPKLKARKDELGRGVPEREIAAYVEANSGKNTKRGLVSLWLSGDREPYISQFFALCTKLGVDPMEILQSSKSRQFRFSSTAAEKHATPAKKFRTAR